MNTNSSDSVDDDNEWTDICRVCLGPDEIGAPLYKPCICAGTIAFVHQKCLEATIAEKRADKCPVCHYKYQFRPLYAQEAPTHLSAAQVISGLVLRAAYKWIPLGLRFLLVLAVWFVVLPLLTAYNYQGWMYGPGSLSSRMEWGFVFGDIVCGLMITATVVISFLALMSLAEHFRFNWQPQRHRLRQEQEEQQQQEEERRLAAVAANGENQQDRRGNDNNNGALDVGVGVGVDKEIINEEFYSHLLQDAGFEFSDKALNGFVTSEEEDSNNTNSNSQNSQDSMEGPCRKFLKSVRNTESDPQYNEEGDESYDHDGIDTDTPGRNKHSIKKDKKIRRKPIGIMDGGEVLHSDDMEQHDQHSYQHHHQRESNDDLSLNNSSIDPNFTLHEKNDSFYSLSSVFDNEDNHEMAIASVDASGGTPIRRQRQRESIQRQLSISQHTEVDHGHDHDNTSTKLNFEDEGGDYNIKSANTSVSLEEKQREEEEEMLKKRSHDEETLKAAEEAQAQFERMMEMQAAQEEEEDDLFRFDMHRNENEHEPENDNNDNPFEPQFEPLDPALANQDQMDMDMDMDMAMPLDEVVGLRGPISSLIKNLLWFLLFNTSFLGVFAFVPSLVGEITFTQYSQSRHISRLTILFFEYIFLLPFLKFTRDGEEEENSNTSLKMAMELLEEETEKQNNIIKPNDIAKIVLGYLSLAVSIFLMQGFTNIYRKSKKRKQSASPDNDRLRDVNYGDIGGFNLDGARQNMNEFDRMEMHEGDNLALTSEKLYDLIECISAVTKVGVLIFLKMCLLPFLLGIWLDISTLDLYKSCVKDRVIFAGVDIVAFFLLHWVVGITFMLLVTVSVLQFREVLHPDILSHIIRPQESQPDLIANLLQDDGCTHVKRIIPSLTIYAGLLALHVWLPAMILAHNGLDEYMALFRPEVWYIVPKRLQIPIELILFHLVMLSMLEKYKNRIGEIQHTCFLKVCNTLQLSHNLLPYSVGRFRLRKVIPLRNTTERMDFHYGKCTTLIDPFWEQLVFLHEKNEGTEEFIESHLQLTEPQTEKYRDLAWERGEPTEPFHCYIALPIFEKANCNSPATVAFTKKLLPPRIGSFRFQKQEGSTNEDISIEIWQEVMDNPVPRPPEGWDYLGDNGGAVEQGRWAWGKEMKSDVESSLAKRKQFFPSIYRNGHFVRPWRSSRFWVSVVPVFLKVGILLIFSWLAVSFSMYGAISIPLAIGRALYKILGIPAYYTHDPFVFIVGSLIFYPLMMYITDLISADRAKNKTIGMLRKMKFIIRVPRRKAIILFQVGCLWLVLSPLTLGFIYKLFFLNSATFWSMEKPDIQIRSVIAIWAVGCILLHLWGVLCYFSAFRRDVWARIGRFAFNDINNNDEIGNRAAPAQQVRQRDDGENSWQGENGIVYRFVDALMSIVIDQEWDKVDRVVLVGDSTLQISKKLLFLLVIPLAISFGCTELLQVISKIYFTNDDRGNIPVEDIRLSLYRWSTVSTFVSMLLFIFQGQIRNWFQVAHKAARDQRYLLGQVLLNRTA